MSAECMAKAKWTAGLTPQARFVLVILADYANEDRIAYPRLATLVAITGFAESTVKAAVRALEEAGAIRREAQFSGGRQQANRYHFLLDAPVYVGPPKPKAPPKQGGDTRPPPAEGQGEGGAYSAPGGGVLRPQGGAAHVPPTTALGTTALDQPPEPCAFGLFDEVLEDEDEDTPAEVAQLPATTPVALSPLTGRPIEGAGGFDAWWAAYPLKVGKQKALEAWPKAFAKFSRGRSGPVGWLLERTAAYVEWATRTDTRLCHGATWLNQERWGDDFTPPPTGGTTHAQQRDRQRLDNAARGAAAALRREAGGG